MSTDKRYRTLTELNKTGNTCTYNILTQLGGVDDTSHRKCKSTTMFVTALSTTGCLMGPNSLISVRETYCEPTNMFTVCMGPPGCGKIQAFRLAILDPLNDVGKKTWMRVMHIIATNMHPLHIRCSNV